MVELLHVGLFAFLLGRSRIAKIMGEGAGAFMAIISKSWR